METNILDIVFTVLIKSYLKTGLERTYTTSKQKQKEDNYRATKTLSNLLLTKYFQMYSYFYVSPKSFYRN